LIVVVGAASRQYDSHIVDPLHVADAEIVYIGSTSDADLWRKINPRVKHLGCTFEKAFCRLARHLAGYKQRTGGSRYRHILDVLRAWFVYYAA